MLANQNTKAQKVVYKSNKFKNEEENQKSTIKFSQLFIKFASKNYKIIGFNRRHEGIMIWIKVGNKKILVLH